MSTKIWNKAISVILAIVMLISAPAVLVRADEEKPEIFVSDVFIAYGKTEDEAVQWLKDNGWEPIKGNNDFNAGKSSAFDSDVAAAMGIRRTSKASEAITDMAVMNMKGGYSFPDYQELIKEKKNEISEFINTFIPVLEEFRENYNGSGSEFGKLRAELAMNILNHFIDGDPKDRYAVNDTGKRLGDLFLEKIRQEGNESGVDLQQIILESSGAAVTMLELTLAIAADSGKETWIERASALTGDDLAEHIAEYVPEAAGQDLAPSAITALLSQQYGDTAAIMASEWSDVNEEMLWYENYNESNDLWQHDGEDDEAYAERISKYFDDMKEKDPDKFDEDMEKYTSYGALYLELYETPYEGKWGDSMGDFFNPADGTWYGGEPEAFLPMAAALSKGQRAALSFVPLHALLTFGFANETTIKDLFPNIETLLKEEDEISIYSGINRGIFRGGVALTSEAEMEKSLGRYDPFNDLWSFAGIYNIVTYSSGIAGILLLGTGAGLWIAGKAAARTAVMNSPKYLFRVTYIVDPLKADIANLEVRIADLKEKGIATQEYITRQEERLLEYRADLNAENAKLNNMVKNAKSTMSTAGKIITGIGGAILIMAALVKGYQMYRYYQKTFTQIPVMIVDESDIVTYTKDSEGKDVKNVEFDQYEYYQAVRCNRQQVGKISDWQDGVESYEEWGCGDVADLNVDQGQEWLALYTVKSSKKGDPILADSLRLQYGSDVFNDGVTRVLHFFTYTNALDLGDMAYCYNNDKNGVYFFWDCDENAYSREAAEEEAVGTASSFTIGYIAIAAAAGLVVGIAGTTLFGWLKKRKKAQKA